MFKKLSYPSAEKNNSYGASNHDCIATNFRVARSCKLKKKICLESPPNK